MEQDPGIIKAFEDLFPGDTEDFSVWWQSGVYGIACLPARKVYIGQTRRRFADRIREHLHGLERGISGNELMQADYDRWSKTEGAWQLLIFAVTDDPDKIEQEFINFFRKFGLSYNLREEVRYTRFRSTHWGTKQKSGRQRQGEGHD